ncbi:MAG: signal peptidase I [Candidatus Dojkabacteria bacterium]
MPPQNSQPAVKSNQGMYDLPADDLVKRDAFDTITDILGNIGSFIFESIEAIVIALALSVVLYLFLFTPHEVVGRSMFPTYKNGEYLIANKIVYKLQEPKRGDVIIFKHSPTQDYIKRIIAIPGDTVEILNNHYIVNGEQLDESAYLDSAVMTSGGEALAEGETITIPEGQLFVSGDNRPNSSDSRAFGPIDIEAVKGKVWLVYFPFDSFRFIKDPAYK